MHQVLPPNPPVGKWEKTAERKTTRHFFTLIDGERPVTDICHLIPIRSIDTC